MYSQQGQSLTRSITSKFMLGSKNPPSIKRNRHRLLKLVAVRLLQWTAVFGIRELQRPPMPLLYISFHVT